VDRVLGHHLILIASAAALCAMSYATGWPDRSLPPDQEVATVLVVAQSGEASKTHAYSPPVPVPRDTEALIREIQRQLKRVGCYDGALDGKWSPQLRTAIKAFADQVNAKLPVDRPDYILLRLTAAHEGRACGTAESKASLPSSPSLLREGRVPAGGTKLP
jgi:hypothetical protein